MINGKPIFLCTGDKTVYVLLDGKQYIVPPEHNHNTEAIKLCSNTPMTTAIKDQFHKTFLDCLQKSLVPSDHEPVHQPSVPRAPKTTGELVIEKLESILDITV